METETTRIAKLIQRNWTGPMWHGGTIEEILKDIIWQQAFAKPENAAHNIYEYVRHMSTWKRFTVEQLKGNVDYKVEMNTEQDWATQYEQTEATWQKALDELQADQTALISALDSMTDEKLSEKVSGRKFDWYVMLHGVVHHDIYHSAQISLLKRLTASK